MNHTMLYPSTYALFRLLAATFAVIWLVAQTPARANAQCTVPLGDLDQNGSTNIADVQCYILVALWSLGGAGGVPACATAFDTAADVNCDGSADVVDVQVAIAAALGIGLSPQVDSDGNGCLDTCETTPEAPILISEVLYDSVGADSNTFVEIAGPPGADLTGYGLRGINGNGGGVYNQIVLSGTIPGDGIYLIVHPDADPGLAALADLFDDNVDYQNGPDSIQLVIDSVVVDAVGYGEFPSPLVFAGEGLPAVDPPAGMSLARSMDLVDTDNNKSDFVALSNPTPGSVSCVPVCTPNAAECVGGLIRFCDLSATGCPVWSEPQACSNGFTCVLGACVASCVDECSLNAKKCEDNGVATCVAGGSGCTEWGDAAPCSSGWVCEQGECMAPCTDECTLGATACANSLFRTCILGADGCATWDDGLACPAPSACVDGGCSIILSQNTELCGVVDLRSVNGDFVVQGGATVTCNGAAASLSVYAKSIFVDPGSSIDLSGKSAIKSGLDFGICDDLNCNTGNGRTGASGGGNGTAGGNSANVSYKYKFSQFGSCDCGTCPGKVGGAIQNTAYDLEVSPGGRGGNGCAYYSEFQGCTDDAFGGKGGGVVRLFGSQDVTILGSVLVDGDNGDGGTLTAGTGGGAGGSILLAAPGVTVGGALSAMGGAGGVSNPFNVSCFTGQYNTNGGAGGQGRVKIVHGGSYVNNGTIFGATTNVSYLPPLDIQSDTHPVSGGVYNSTFDSFHVTWTKPYSSAAGYWWALSKSANFQLTPANGTYTTTPNVVVPASAFTSAGTWYFYVVTVHSNAETSTIANKYSFYVNNSPHNLTSPTHPIQTVWYSEPQKTTVTMAWSPPAGLSSSHFSGYWYKLDHQYGTLPGTEEDGYTFTPNTQVVLTHDWQGLPIGPGAYHFHLVAEDLMGNPTPVAVQYLLQIGSEPAKMNLFGYVKGPGNVPVTGALVQVHPYGNNVTTDVNGYFLISSLYLGKYDVYVTHPNYATLKQSIELSASIVPLTLNVTP